jgi:hypothetical protein
MGVHLGNRRCSRNVVSQYASADPASSLLLLHIRHQYGVSPLIPNHAHVDHVEALKEPGPMSEHKRILVIAQPELGRRLEHHLRAAGWSVYRSPDPSLISDMVRSLKPSLLIVGLDAPWFDRETLAKLLAATDCETPVLALTDDSTATGAGLATFLPASIEPQLLLVEMDRAIASDDRCRREFDDAVNARHAPGGQPPA